MTHTDPKALYRTTVTFWTSYDPDRVSNSDLGRESDSGDGFAGGRDTETVSYAALMHDPAIGEDLLEFFQITPASAGLPLCQVGECGDDPDTAEEAVMLLPRYNAEFEITDWTRVCERDSKGDWFGAIPEQHRVRYHLRHGRLPGSPHLTDHPDVSAVLAFGAPPRCQRAAARSTTTGR
ncbi:hypothetical protein [Micromonospora aurantiaca (nom. illeg.)]|uniref:hypothetical protein n=1 Tax=Micromonospora aurantiaca (nom. illeg.) TaxID=47850 RepID=UPI0033F801B5